MTFIIAEVGSNWLTFQDCLDSIKAAKECGADAVKFQMYTHKELYGYDEQVRQVIDEQIYEGPRKLAGELPREWVPKLAAHCDEVGIEFMCTAFSPEGYRFIDPYVKRHKIASAENTDKDILKTVNELGKPVLLSTGGSDIDEVYNSYTKLDKVHTTLMYCVSAYPAKNISLENIRSLERLTPFTGYSCHTDDWVTAVYAVQHYQAEVIEKHFKVRPMYTPDSDHSILPHEFRMMVDAIRQGHVSQIMPWLGEEDMVKYYKRRFIPELNGYYRTKKPE